MIASWDIVHADTFAVHATPHLAHFGAARRNLVRRRSRKCGVKTQADEGITDAGCQGNQFERWNLKNCKMGKPEGR
jgi:hypothetical protein